MLRDKSLKADSTAMLADVRTLSLLIARIKLHLESCTEKKRKKEYSSLISSLSFLLTVRNYVNFNEGQSPLPEQSLYIDGLPRWMFQITTQFGHYVNPESGFREKWQIRRTSIWAGIESSIPASVRDLLLSWRWKAEISAFRKILTELQLSQQKVLEIDRQFRKCEKSSSKLKLNLGLIDRIQILKWSRQSKSVEDQLPRLEEEKQKKLNEISEVLGECERLAARISFEMKTAMVDCGGYYPLVFEESARTIDNEIKKELIHQFSEKFSENEVLKKNIDKSSRISSEDFKKANDLSSQFNRSVSGEWDKKVLDARIMLEREFLCLNAFEIQQQEDAHQRWKNAVRQMLVLVKTAEENLLHGRGIN